MGGGVVIVGVVIMWVCRKRIVESCCTDKELEHNANDPC